MHRNTFFGILCWAALIVAVGLGSGWDQAWDLARFSLLGLLVIPALLIAKWVDDRRRGWKKKVD